MVVIKHDYTFMFVGMARVCLRCLMRPTGITNPVGYTSTWVSKHPHYMTADRALHGYVVLVEGGGFFSHVSWRR